MACNCNQNQRPGCVQPPRPQMPEPPCMNSSCGCGCGAVRPPRPETVPCRDPQIQPRAAAQTGAEARPLPSGQGPMFAGSQPLPAQAMVSNQNRVPVQGMMPMQNTAQGMMPVQNTAQGMMPVQNAAQGMMPVQNTAQGTASCGLEQMPLAMGYVPWQRWCQTYPVQQGFERGTLFPQLDLPFVMGRCR